jgi:uncharacterized protein DUF1206
MSITTARVKNSTTTQVLGRAGMVCYGVVHVLVAYLAVRVAFGAGSQQADQRGAIEEVGSTGMGGILLWVLALGLWAFGAWQLLTAAIGYRWINSSGKRTFKRVGAAGRGIVVIALGVTSVKYATGSSSGGSSDQQQQTLTAKLLALPAGPAIVLVVALGIVVVATALVVEGVRKSFLDDLDTTELPNGTQRWVRRLGVFGHVAKGVTFGIVAVLIGIAALTSDPNQAGGLDAALRTLARQPFGPVLLCVVALGFAAFGAFCFAAARAQRS